MNLETSRFGTVTVQDDQLVTLPAGLLGFPDCHRFALLQNDEAGAFRWLQSADLPDLAFVVTDPSLWVPDYQVAIRREQMEELGMDRLEDATVLVIVNKRDDVLSANLQGPVVVNATTGRAMQLVLADKRWTTRHELLRVGEPLKATA